MMTASFPTFTTGSVGWRLECSYLFSFSSTFLAQACYNHFVLGSCERIFGCHTSIDFLSSHVTEFGCELLLCGGGPAAVSPQGGPKWAKSCTWAIWPTA